MITLADNEMKALTSKFFTTFTQLRGSGKYTFIDGLSLQEKIVPMDAVDLTNVDIYLTELDLRGNVLTKLPDAVAEMKHLTCINLANNSFSVFPDKLTEIATLERINLEGNSITGNDNILKVQCAGFREYVFICA